MAYRAWPAAVLTGASLAAALVVVGDHVVATGQGCRDSAGWFTATPVAWPAQSTERADAAGKPGPDRGATDRPSAVEPGGQNGDVEAAAEAARQAAVEAGGQTAVEAAGQAAAEAAGQTGDHEPSGDQQISGCLDLDRIEIPAPAPASDDRA